MTNQEKFIRTFGEEAWAQMIVFAGIAEQFKEFWTSPYRQQEARWIEKNVDESTTIDAWQVAKCSKCGLYHTTPYLYYFYDYPFCPHCGEDMRGDKNG